MAFVKLSTTVLQFSSSGASSVFTSTLILTNTSVTDVAFTLRASNELYHRARPSLGIIPAGQAQKTLFYRKPTRTAPSVGISRESYTLCVAPVPNGVLDIMSPQRVWKGVQKFDLKIEFLKPHTKRRSASSARRSSPAIDLSVNTKRNIISDARVLRFAPTLLGDRSIVCDTMRIANISGHDLAFNVHSTSTQRFRVIPSSGIIPKDQSRYVIFRFESRRSVPRIGMWDDMFLLCLAKAPNVGEGQRYAPMKYWARREDTTVFRTFLFSEFRAMRTRKVSESVEVGPRHVPVARLSPVVSPSTAEGGGQTSDSLQHAVSNKDLDIVRMDKMVVSLRPCVVQGMRVFCDMVRISNVSKSDVAFCLDTGDETRVVAKPSKGVIGKGESGKVLFVSTMGQKYGLENVHVYVTESAGMGAFGVPEKYWTRVRKSDVDVVKIEMRVERSDGACVGMDVAEMSDLAGMVEDMGKDVNAKQGVRSRILRRFGRFRR